MAPLSRDWIPLTEEEGLGRGPGDTFQEQVADAIVANLGGYIAGRGGAGKSHVIKLLREKFAARGYEVHCVAFTHVASQNVEGNTILHELHRFIKGKRRAIVVDESSMMPLSMWAALANLKFAGNVLVVLGDVDGQFLPIEDQTREWMLKGLDQTPFMHDLVNGLHVTLRKYRRGTDVGHYQFVGSLYPSLGLSLPAALEKARAEYPAHRGDFLGTTLCISHFKRMDLIGG